MVKIGNFFYHYRNFLFPVFYAALFIPSKPLFQNFWYAIAIGLFITCLGQFVRIFTIGFKYIIRGGKNRKVYAEDLVTDGIFAHCRNPMYVGNVLMLLGMGIMSNSILFVGLFIPFFIFIYQSIIRAEEDFLFNKFGAPYKAYMADVNRWIPQFKGLKETISNMEYKWKRVVLKEYTTTYIWLGGIALMFIKNIRLNLPQQFEANRYFFIAILLAIVCLYLFTRWLKKSGRITENVGLST